MPMLTAAEFVDATMSRLCKEVELLSVYDCLHGSPSLRFAARVGFVATFAELFSATLLAVDVPYGAMVSRIEAEAMVCRNVLHTSVKEFNESDKTEEDQRRLRGIEMVALWWARGIHTWRLLEGLLAVSHFPMIASVERFKVPESLFESEEMRHLCSIILENPAVQKTSDRLGYALTEMTRNGEESVDHYSDVCSHLVMSFAYWELAAAKGDLEVPTNTLGQRTDELAAQISRHYDQNVLKPNQKGPKTVQ